MNNAIKIFRKEVRDFARDKRVRSNAFFGPFFTVIIMVMAFGFLMDTIGKPQGQKIHVVSHSGQAILTGALKEAHVTAIEVGTLEEGKELLKSGKAKVVVDAGPDFDKALSGTKPVKVNEYFDPNQESSGVAKTFADKILGAVGEARVKAVLIQANSNPDLSSPVVVSPHEVTQGGGGASALILGLLPYLIVLWSFYGGLGAVSDLVAGEKEKNTLETLLITPVARKDIALGKLIALALLCATSSLSAVVALAAAYYLHLPKSSALFANGLGITPVALLQLLVVLIPSVFLSASVLVAVSTRARNVRESQTQLTIISMFFLMPAMFSQFIGYTDYARSVWISLVPVLNSATSIRQALSGEFHAGFLAATVAENALLGLLAMAYAVSLFKREDVLLRV